MAIQGCGPGWKPSCRSTVLERDQDLLATRDLVNGSHEGPLTLAYVLLPS